MSWPVASFSIVALILAGGWLAYERRRPSARMAAVVAVMAALAALGRDAFAALPDVKPITAMTLVVGYALGPLPGFAVGALGMLVSNFMLGQGPYTPWQMAAWGMVGLGGALLGRISGRRLPRLPLALACGLAALAAKEVMNLYTWTLGASHTPAAFIAVAGQAVSYDITDTVASFLFGLAFAPELFRILDRMRARMNVVWLPPPTASAAGGDPRDGRGRALGVTGALVAVVIAGAMLLGLPHPAAAHPRRAPASGGGSTATAAASSDARTAVARAVDTRLAISRELAFLAGAQNPDGGFGGARGQASSELYSAWVAIGVAATGRDPLSLRRNGHTVLAALLSEASSLHGAGDLERTILALHACGASLHTLPGGDPVTRLLGFRDGDGSFGHLSNLTAFAIFALRAAGYGPTSRLVRGAGRWLARQQNGDGGFGFGTRGGGSDVDDTAAAVQAIVDTGAPSRSALARAGTFLLHAQNRDGGYPQQSGGESNAQSTAWAIQGLTATGRNVAAVMREGSRSPVAYLQTLLAPDGSVRYSRTGAQTPVWVTAQALTALAQKTFPVSPPRRAHRSSSTAAASATLPANTGRRHAASARSVVTSSRPAGLDAGSGLAQLERGLGRLAQLMVRLLASVMQ